MNKPTVPMKAVRFWSYTVYDAMLFSENGFVPFPRLVLYSPKKLEVEPFVEWLTDDKLEGDDVITRVLRSAGLRHRLVFHPEDGVSISTARPSPQKKKGQMIETYEGDVVALTSKPDWIEYHELMPFDIAKALLNTDKLVPFDSTAEELLAHVKVRTREMVKHDVAAGIASQEEADELIQKIDFHATFGEKLLHEGVESGGIAGLLRAAKGGHRYTKLGRPEEAGLTADNAPLTMAMYESAGPDGSEVFMVENPDKFAPVNITEFDMAVVAGGDGYGRNAVKLRVGHLTQPEFHKDARNGMIGYWLFKSAIIGETVKDKRADGAEGTAFTAYTNLQVWVKSPSAIDPVGQLALPDSVVKTILPDGQPEPEWMSFDESNEFNRANAVPINQPVSKSSN